jgi:hypothetical protein
VRTSPRNNSFDVYNIARIKEALWNRMKKICLVILLVLLATALAQAKTCIGKKTTAGYFDTDTMLKAVELCRSGNSFCGDYILFSIEEGRAVALENVTFTFIDQIKDIVVGELPDGRRFSTFDSMCTCK